MKGTVNTPRTFVVTVSMSAITPLPSADVTSVTPEVKVVGTQAKSARPVTELHGLERDLHHDEPHHRRDEKDGNTVGERRGLAQRSS